MFFKFIKFLTGSRTGANLFYKNGPFKTMWPNPPSAPLHLEDFESVKLVASGPLNLLMIVKCTFKNEEEAIAVVTYPMLQVLSKFISV